VTGKLRLRWAEEHAWSVEILEADPVVEFADEFLEALRAQDRMDVSVGDGILTIRGINRTVSYGLAERNLLRNSTVGHLSGT
jgi:hypothetical protein